MDKFLYRREKKSLGVARSMFKELNEQNKKISADKLRNGKIMLHNYCKHATYDTIKEIAKFTSCIDQLDNRAQTALFISVAHGNIGASRALLESGANVNHNRPTSNYYRYTTRMWPLRVAISNGNIDMIRLLIQFGANLEKRDDMNVSDHYIACRMGRIDIMYLIAQHISDVNFVLTGLEGSRKTLLYYAVKLRNHELVDYLLSRGADPNPISNTHCVKGRKTALVLAIENEDAKMIRTLVRNGADINLVISHRFHAMSIAILMGNLNIIRLCLALGSEVNIRDIKYICKYNLYNVGVIISCRMEKWRWVHSTYFIAKPKFRRMAVLYDCTGLYRCYDITLSEITDFHLQVQEEKELIDNLKIENS